MSCRVHRDSAEGLLGLEGEVEATVGEAHLTLRAGEIAVVPSMVPHGLRNVGQERARVLGFFGSATNVATFADSIFVVGAPLPIRVPLEEPALALPVSLKRSIYVGGRRATAGRGCSPGRLSYWCDPQLARCASGPRVICVMPVPSGLIE